MTPRGQDSEATADDRPHMVIAGASGVVGHALVAAAVPRWRITALTRTIDGDEPEGSEPVVWNPSAAREGDGSALADLAARLDGADALVNLAGASIDRGRFGERHRERVLRSRLDATSTLLAASEACARPPDVWLQASAVGIYGDRGDEELTEASAPADDFFLAEVCRRWEATAAPAAARSRLAIARFGMVLAPDAAAWRKLATPVRLGVGGPLGSGRQWWSWIHADDLARALLFLVDPPAGAGAPPPAGVHNLTAPEPLRQHDFMRTVAREARRPSFVPVPAFALRIALGGLADMLLLPSARVRPARLLDAGFRFEYPTLRDAASDLLEG